MDQPVKTLIGRFSSLQEWLSWQQELHFSSIDLGLERCRLVAERMGLLNPPYKIVTVAGTNGKGSSAVMLDGILRNAGYHVGCYTSPHLVRYNERILVNGIESSDEMLCRSFQNVDQARGDISLTYFEFGTLAALDIFRDAGLDAGILEVGLGGRLDAVNIVDADVALLCSIDIDHVNWLGHDRAGIGYEKAGIFRPLKPAVCADFDPPDSVGRHAENLGTEIFFAGKDFTFTVDGSTWAWNSRGRTISDIPVPDRYNNMQIQNAAAVLKVLEILTPDLPVTNAQINESLSRFRMPGRMQIVDAEIPIVLDVSHNPQAIENLRKYLDENPVAGATHMVIGFLNDKDYRQMLRIIRKQVDCWYIATLQDERSLDGGILKEELKNLGVTENIRLFTGAVEAMKQAQKHSLSGDRIVVTGSFITVGKAMTCIDMEV